MATAQTLVLEDASLELVPKRFQGHKNCSTVLSRFGILPCDQILDDNFHNEILKDMKASEKRGRPDVVHIALLDVCSTPLFDRNLVRVIIHTVNDTTIMLKPRVRIPRTLIRFNGVMSKLLKDKPEPNSFFEIVVGQNILELVSTLNQEMILLSKKGVERNLRNFIERRKFQEKEATWVIGGFPFGHFDEELLGKADEIISISNHSLPAHVVAARLCYDLEEAMGLLKD